MKYNPKEFGMRITKLRKERGKTQQEMADLLHTTMLMSRACSGITSTPP